MIVRKAMILDTSLKDGLLMLLKENCEGYHEMYKTHIFPPKGMHSIRILGLKDNQGKSPQRVDTDTVEINLTE